MGGGSSCLCRDGGDNCAGKALASGGATAGAISSPGNASFPVRVVLVVVVLLLLARDLVEAFSHQSPSLRASRMLLSDKDTELSDRSAELSDRDTEETTCRYAHEF